ncbi:calcium-binding protein [Oryzicola mucosus]|uniref:Calcium-binding protein n=1 Tax=Oryzicola mucosus TaxID=2767425 RepID=A0A8J6PLQ9_9HYPH|nr:hypothetical protein [Oryzicola mucosus]
MAIIITSASFERRENGSTDYQQDNSDVVALAGGGYQIVWQENSSSILYLSQIQGRTYDAGDNSVGSFNIGSYFISPPTPTAPSVAALSDGGFVVAWNGTTSLSTEVINVMRFNADGSSNPQYTAVQESDPSDASSRILRPSVSGVTTGGYNLVWGDTFNDITDASGSAVYRQRYNASDGVLYPTLLVNTTTAGNQVEPVVIGLYGGGSVIVWQGDANAFSDIYAQRFTSNFGVPTGGEVVVNTVNDGYQTAPAATALPDGGYVIVWQSASQSDVGWDIHGQRYNANGVRVGTEFRANATTTGNQHSVDVAELTDGGFVVVWVSDGQDGDGQGVYAQRYSASGAKVGSELLVAETTAGNQFNPAVAGLSGGRFIVTWTMPDAADTDDLPDTGIFSRIFEPSDVTNGTLSSAIEIAQGDGANDIFKAAPGTLNRGDQIHGGGGTDRIQLTKGGTYDLAAVSAITNVERLVGSAGNDTVLVSNAVLAGITSVDLGAGTDIFVVRDSFTLKAGMNVAAIRTSNTAANVAINITGNEFGQTITGNAMANTLRGEGGNDVLNGGGGADLIRAGDGNDTAYGGEGDDTLEGWAGDDKLYGGSGNDVFYGNTGNDLIQGEDGNDVIYAQENDDKVYGGSGSDTIYAGTGNDIVDGGTGGDVMRGEAGNDIFYVDNAGDNVVEINGEGNDKVISSVSYTLAGRYVETLDLVGTGNINATGNKLNNVLDGNNGSNILNGMAGKDTLTGKGGADRFVFDQALGASNVDTITDFYAPDDSIRIDNAVFLGLSAGNLSSAAFRANTTGNAADASDRIIYETDTGELYFDRDGSGSTYQPVLFAILSNQETISYKDFLII